MSRDGIDLERLERDMSTGMLQVLAIATIAKQGPIHGYGLIKEMDEVIGQRGWWKEGTVYPLLANLEKQGILRSRWGKPGSGARRKYYEITGAGRKALEAAHGSWDRLRDAMEQALEGT